MVGKTGFEPATPWSQTKCSTKLSYSPIKSNMARPKGVEPITFWSVVRRSIQLSYGRIFFFAIKLIRIAKWMDILLRKNWNLFCFAKSFGAEDRNRTGTVVTYRRILSPVRLPVPPPRQVHSGAEDGIRTRDPNLGKVVFYHWTTSAYGKLFTSIKTMVRVKGVEPPRLAALDPKSSASANSATPA